MKDRSKSRKLEKERTTLLYKRYNPLSPEDQYGIPWHHVFQYFGNLEEMDKCVETDGLSKINQGCLNNWNKL